MKDISSLLQEAAYKELVYIKPLWELDDLEDVAKKALSKFSKDLDGISIETRYSGGKKVGFNWSGILKVEIDDKLYSSSQIQKMDVEIKKEFGK